MQGRQSICSVICLLLFFLLWGKLVVLPTYLVTPYISYLTLNPSKLSIKKSESAKNQVIQKVIRQEKRWEEQEGNRQEINQKKG